jgi:hypothetical protein
MNAGVELQCPSRGCLLEMGVIDFNRSSTPVGYCGWACAYSYWLVQVGRHLRGIGKVQSGHDAYHRDTGSTAECTCSSLWTWRRANRRPLLCTHSVHVPLYVAARSMRSGRGSKRWPPVAVMYCAVQYIAVRTVLYGAGHLTRSSRTASATNRICIQIDQEHVSFIRSIVHNTPARCIEHVPVFPSAGESGEFGESGLPNSRATENRRAPAGARPCFVDRRRCFGAKRTVKTRQETCV